MQKSIANIITNANKVDFDYKFNKCKTLEEIDTSLPTLIIGLENAKKYIKDFNILKKEYIEQNLWWTFKKTEKRAIYDIDIVNFNNMVIDFLVKDVKYSLIDIVNLDKTKKYKVIKYLLSNEDKLLYNYFNKFLFIYSSEHKIVWGISLTTLRYCGIDTNKLLGKIYKNKNNRQIIDIDVIPLSVKKITYNDIHKQVALYDYFS